MPVSIDLYQLVKTLTKSEKGYLKKYLYKSGEKENIHLEFYDRILKLLSKKKVDMLEMDQQLRDEFEGKTKQHFSALKNYTFNRIVDTLNEYHFKSDSFYQAFNDVFKVRLFRKKGMFKAANDLSQNNLNKSIDLENYSLSTFFSKELIINAKAERKFGLDSPILKVLENFDELRLQQNKLLDLQHIYHKVFNYLVTVGEFLRDEESREYLKGIMEAPILHEDGKDDTFRVNKQRGGIWNLYLMAMGEDEKWLINQAEQVDMYVNNPKWIKKEPWYYLISINNTLQAALNNNNLEVYNKYKDEFFNYKPSLGTRTVHFWEMQFYMRLLEGLTLGNFSNLREMEKEFERALKDFDGQLSEVKIVSNSASMATHFFYIGDFKRAAKWTNWLRTQGKKSVRQEMQAVGRIIELISNWELGNDYLLPYMWRSVYRFLMKSDKKYAFESEILNTVKIARTFTGKKELNEHLKSRLPYLKKLAEDPFENRFLDYFDYQSWVKGKIEDKNIFEIKYGKKTTSSYLKSVTFPRVLNSKPGSAPAELLR